MRSTILVVTILCLAALAGAGDIHSFRTIDITPEYTEYLNAVLKLSENNYLFVGNYYDSTLTKHDIINSYDTLGNLRWSTDLSSVSEKLYALEAYHAPNKGFIISGRYFPDSSYYYNTVLVAFDSNGIELWSHNYDQYDFTDVGYISFFEDNTILVAMNATREIYTGFPQADILMYTYTPDGIQLSEQFLTSSLYNQGAYYLLPFENNNLLLIGNIAYYDDYAPVFASLLDKQLKPGTYDEIWIDGWLPFNTDYAITKEQNVLISGFDFNDGTTYYPYQVEISTEGDSLNTTILQQLNISSPQILSSLDNRKFLIGNNYTANHQLQVVTISSDNKFEQNESYTVPGFSGLRLKNCFHTSGTDPSVILTGICTADTNEASPLFFIMNISPDVYTSSPTPTIIVSPADIETDNISSATTSFFILQQQTQFNLSKITLNSITINASTVPSVSRYFPYHPAYDQAVLKLTVPTDSLLAFYQPIWNNTLQPVSIRGQLQDNIFNFTAALQLKGPICGDLNTSHPGLDINDLLILVNYIYGDASVEFELMPADADGSGTVDLTDILIFVDYMFNNGPLPPCRN